VGNTFDHFVDMRWTSRTQPTQRFLTITPITDPVSHKCYAFSTSLRSVWTIRITRYAMQFLLVGPILTRS
jgi:hypothetical protein